MAEHESAANKATPDDYEWDPAYAARAIAALREQLAAANERALEAETNATRYRKLNHDLARGTMRQMEKLSQERDEARARLAEHGDWSGWTAAENAEFEQRYGVQAAWRLQAANDRVWAIVRDLRTAAVEEGRDPYQDPMAQRLSAALVGAESDDLPSADPERS